MPPAASLATSLKKGEGEPLSRHDIQYALLEKIFNDKRAVFTPRPGSVHARPGNRITFGDLYVEDVLASNKLSKTLKEKFLNDMQTTRKVCMASLLVNTGRINTTLVFTHTQARTYNPIPAIQAYGAGHKMLQDAPRLKHILKGSCAHGPPDWKTFRDAQKNDAPKPLVNPVSLIFLLTHVSTVPDIQHFPDRHYHVHELLSDYHYTSDSRAVAFLWIMYFYIETDGSAEAQLRNPFGPGPGNCMVPPMECSRERQSLAENIDLPVEIEYAERMAEKRRRHLATIAQQKASESASSTPRLKGTPTPSAAAAAAAESDRDKSETPPAEQDAAAAVDAAAAATTPSQFELDSVRRSSRKVKKRTYESAADGGEEFMDLVGGGGGGGDKDDYRTLRANQILRHSLQRSLHASKKTRRQQSPMQRAFALSIEDDDDDRLLFDDEDGEEAVTLAKVLRRAQRRVERPRKKPLPAPTTDEKRIDATSNSSAKKSSGGGFKIKLKF